MSLKKRLWCRFLVFGVGCVAILLSGTPASGQSKVTLETIAKAWKDRQDRTRSLRCAWTERETLPKGYVTTTLRMMPMGQHEMKRLGIPPGKEIPPTDVAYDVPSLLVLDGDKMRYEREDREWSPEKSAFVPWPRVVAFDGKVGKVFYPISHPTKPWPRGRIEGGNPATRPALLCPLVVLFRPFEPQLCGSQISTMQLTGRKADIKGRSCLELERPGSVVERMWVDPARDFVVVRIISLENEQTRGTVNVEYREDVRAGWVPHAWDITNLDSKGRLRMAVRAQVTSCEINPSVAQAEFDIDFPPGTYVTDTRDSSEYVVREGGGKRKVMPEERSASYQQIVNSDSGEALGKRSVSSFAWRAFPWLIVLLVAGGLLVWRMRAVRKRPA